MTIKTIFRRAKVDDAHLPQDLHPIIRQVYASRGMSDPADADLTLKGLLPPNTMKGLQQAALILYQAILNQDKIIIIGDFDADGATSTALMMEALSLFGSFNHDFLVPNRFEFGYGLSPEIVEVASKQGANVIVTVDSGISCHQGVERANELGIDVVITDHHLPGAHLPEAAAIVNPNQLDCSFASKSIAGVGVAFYLALALRALLREKNWFSEQGFDEPNLAQLLDIVALGTVADVVALDKNNRILVAQGIERIRRGLTRPGIQALINVAKRNQFNLVASDFGFALGPRINAAGRLDDMTFGIRCLLAKSDQQAKEMAQELDLLNKARREIEQSMQHQAEMILQQLNDSSKHNATAIALYQRDWHQGVIGIVAGRLKEKLHRPCIVFAQDENGQDIKGSARSIPGLHIRDLLENISSQHPGLIKKFGGHAMAAGLTIAETDFEQFEKLFDLFAIEALDEKDLQGVVLSDGELPVEAYSIEFASLLRESGPWGQKFEEPVFDDVFTIVQQRIVGEKHLKLVLAKEDVALDAIAFNVDLDIWPNATATQVHVAFKLDINEFRGKQNVQLMVEQLSLDNL
ncbi:single-stranded-DNA-specific exonuclease RecJ [Thalassotalea agarivorans]|uniref:Single-stranded-DNA-specific exonuclease RecJ n=1 Tax=Thalassotalea agarivorans TaxID=349064 RepID=A0A1H9Y1S8_THASX|nr:single-stranded-DNA-specific exonuclease RecJ [Thalassotalea agarivorans]SES62231.1 exonuclease RecJ [Thalassotalea agarivorans]